MPWSSDSSQPLGQSYDGLASSPPARAPTAQPRDPSQHTSRVRGWGVPIARLQSVSPVAQQILQGVCTMRFLLVSDTGTAAVTKCGRKTEKIMPLAIA